jgi:mRNA interferase MazF
MVKGDIVLIPFPYTDLSGSKLRPVVILFETAQDLVVCFITTQLTYKEPTDFEIVPSITNGLKWQSLVRAGKIATIKKSLSEGIFGKLNQAEIIQLDINLKKILQLK